MVTLLWCVVMELERDNKHTPHAKTKAIRSSCGNVYVGNRRLRELL